MISEAEQKVLLAKEEYALEQKAFYEIRMSMPSDKRLRSLSQRADYEYARIQLSKAAKRLREAENEMLISQAVPKMQEVEREVQREKYGAVPEELAKSIFAAIEKGRRRA